MTLQPCLICGVPSEATRCPEHPPKRRLTSRLAGYDSRWDRLSRRARKAQPFCTECSATEDLQLDHSAQAWQRQDAGLAIRLSDVRVLCGPCNRAAGPAHAPRGLRP